MSTPTPKRAPPGPAGRTNSSTTSGNTGAPQRSPSRLNSSSSTTANSTPANGLNRTRSVRSGTPVSARAAVRKPTPADPSADDDAKAEMQARIDELAERLQQSELTNVESQKQCAVLQLKLDDACKGQTLLEESLHEHTERINDLEGEKRESLRARREMEQIYESERAAVLKEKEESLSREEEMQSAMQRLKETLAQREMRGGLGDEERKPHHLSRQSSSLVRSRNVSPNPETMDRQFAPSSTERSDSSSRSSSKLILQKDKLIESLRLELAEVQIKLVEMENMGGGRMQELQKQMYEIKMQNARLMEENESFQLLLSEKTLNGDFLRPPSASGSRPPSSRRRDDSMMSSRGLGGATLADELEDSHIDDGEVVGGASDETRRLQAEVQSMKDQNKALTLYINNIISRLLQHEQFEQILDKTPDLMAGPGAASKKYAAAAAAMDESAGREKELPPPPSEKDDDRLTAEGGSQALASTASGFLQRARSVIGGTAGTRPRARPQSQIFSPSTDTSIPPRPSLSSHLSSSDQQLRLTENPQTAPSVPLGRSQSVRHASGHRRANSEWPAASLVTNMYRPTPSISPLSPGLSSPTRGGGFFAMHRAPSSGTGVPTIAEKENGGGNKENAIPPSTQQRDSKISNGEAPQSSGSNPPSRNSTSIDPGTSFDSSSLDASAPTATTINSNPSSPPRSTTSSGDKDAKSAGAIMMGSKMRPLRLVQNASAEAAEANKAANRGSWFGWMNKGASAAPGPGVFGASPPE